MKLFGKTRDGVIDDLLRAYVSRPKNARQCSEFDPDLANTYVERRLSGASLSRYEAHLSDCAACRKNVVALSGLAAAEASPAATFARAIPAAEPSFAARLFASMSAPRWAMAAAAVIVLAVSLPLLLSRNGTDLNKAAEFVAQETPSDKPQSNPSIGEARDSTAVPVAASKPEAPALKSRGKREGEADSANGLLAVSAQPKPTEENAASDLKAAEKKSNEPADQLQQKAETQTVAAAPPAPSQGQSTKSDSNAGRQQQSKDAVAPPEVSQARGDEQRHKESVAKAEAVQPPAAPSASGPVRSRKGPGKLSLRDSESEAARPAEKKFSGKPFLFTSGAWTDKDFDPDKDLPVVTLIRDSNVYKEVIAKHARLRAYFANLPANERMIVVYKGTVYKLIPQQGDK